MSPDAIVAVGMGIFVVIFWVIVISKLHDTIVSPLRIFYPFKVAYRRFIRPTDGPVLSDLEMSDSLLLLGEHAMISGHSYSVLTNSHGAAMVLVQLNFPVAIHIVAIGNKSGWVKSVNKLRLRTHLAQVSLEGDYPQHITMFCSRGKELELLQLFDPVDMAYFIDFCLAYNFEIYKDCLYISQSTHTEDLAGTTTILKDAEKFIERNEKLLARI